MLTLNNRKLKNQIYNEYFSRVYSCSLNSKILNNKVCVRTMMSSKSFYAIRAIFNTAMMLSNTEMVDKITSKNKKPFVERAVDLALDHNKGALQQKTAILKHITNQQFPADHFYEPYQNETGQKTVHWETNATIDCRTLNELGVLNEYQKHFSNDITWILATLDKRGSNFYGAKQPNVDFWVYIDRGMGLNSTVCKGIYQDEKSGMDMLKHSTRGSISLLSYDESGNNIQTMNEVVTATALAQTDFTKIRMLIEAAKTDEVFPCFKQKFNDYLAICNEMKVKDLFAVTKLHQQLQDKLWTEIQCNPEFKRSLSFIFIKQIVTCPTSSQEQAFSHVFRSHIQEDKLYDLDRRQDFNTLYKAMIYAGKEIDSQFVKKLDYMHNNGIVLNKSFLTILADLIKYGL